MIVTQNVTGSCSGVHFLGIVNDMLNGMLKRYVVKLELNKENVSKLIKLKVYFFQRTS